MLLGSLMIGVCDWWSTERAAASRGLRSSGFKVAGTPPAPVWDLLVGACSAVLQNLGAAAPHEIGSLLFAPRLKLLLVDDDFERSLKRKQASREAQFCLVLRCSLLLLLK